MRKFCTDEVGHVKMKKNGFCNLKKNKMFFTSHFLGAPLALHFNDDL
jgi:hypothetical protein